VDVAADSRGVRAAAWWLAGFVLLVLVAALVLLLFNAQVMSAGRFGAYGFAAVTCAVYAGVGGLLAARVPRNAIGWLLCLLGLFLAASLFFEQYGLRGLASAPGSLLAVRQVAALGVPAATLAVVPLIIVVLLFPDGQLPSRRWRPVLWGAIEVAVVGGAGTLLQRGTVVSGSLTNALQAAHVAYPNPLGVFPRQGWYGAVLAVTAVIALATALLAVASVVARRRRAAAELRQQLAWLAYVGVLFLAALAAFLADGIRTRGAGGPLLTFLFILVAGIALLGVPAACAVAVLKYRLYDLDVVVRKTVVAGLVAGTFTVIYALVVLGAGALAVRPGNGLLTFTAAAIAAVLLQPVRARAGLLADHLVYGRRATPYEVLSEFSERMAGTPPTEDVLPRMARMLAEATGAEQTQVWLRAAGAERLAAAWPAVDGSASRPAGPESVADDGRTRVFAVEHQGKRLGSLRITSSLREPLTPAGERLVRDVAAQAGLVLRNVALIGDLRASRQRIVASADQARRTLERDLHDGAQQQLVALRINLGLARQVLHDSPAEADELLAETEHAAAEALEELRDLARGIYPPLLSDLGLRAALEAQARKAALLVTIEADTLGRYPQDAEAAIYFSVLEALQNVAKYAHASSARVTLRYRDAHLTFTVHDDGKGFDPATTSMGTGLHGIGDRCAALGGDVTIDSAPGRGTQVSGRIPAHPI
jgi:signal transduction histidine kinase